jgi:hypothetical protein
MNLALGTFSAVRRISAFGGACPDRGLQRRIGVSRSNAVRVFQPRRPSAQLVAGWHVSPETGRLECRWSLEDSSADDPLCAPHDAEAASRAFVTAPSSRPLAGFTRQRMIERDASLSATTALSWQRAIVVRTKAEKPSGQAQLESVIITRLSSKSWINSNVRTAHHERRDRDPVEKPKCE